MARMVSLIVQGEAERLSEALAILAEPHRLLVLRQLRRGPCSAGALARAVGVPASLASHHLAALVRVGLVTRRRSGHYICYAVDHDGLSEVYRHLGRMTGLIGAAAEAAGRAGQPC
jgi:DNA-binding transcriptional ArsR family regulator